MKQRVAILHNVGGFVFDATFKETHSSTLKVTDNPLETGVLVSDHAYMDPRKLTVSAGVSDTPLSVSEGDQFAASARRSVRAYELLQELQRAAEPFTVQTGLKLYTNMLLTDLRVEQDKDTEGVFVFDADLREIMIVSTQSVKYPPRKAGATKRQAGAKTDNGEQQGKGVTAPKQSLLKRLLGR